MCSIQQRYRWTRKLIFVDVIFICCKKRNLSFEFCTVRLNFNWIGIIELNSLCHLEHRTRVHVYRLHCRRNCVSGWPKKATSLRSMTKSFISNKHAIAHMQIYTDRHNRFFCVPSFFMPIEEQALRQEKIMLTMLSSRNLL